MAKAWSELDYTEVIRQRAERLKWLRSSPENIAAARVYYKDNPVDFIEHWLWTYDPRPEATMPHMPFILFARQIDYVHWLTKRITSITPGLVEKCRDAGVSYVSIAWAVHRFMFHDEKIGFGSRKAVLVDKLGSMDSLLEKARAMLRLIPRELFQTYQSDNGEWTIYNEETNSKIMQITNPGTGSVIFGEGGDDIGRGGRSTIYFKDESGHYERPQRIEAALSANTSVQIDISSVNGVGNPFYQKRHSGAVDVFIFDWREDPRKDQAWYDEQVKLYGKVIVAQEIDRDYAASMEGVCIPAKWVSAAVGLDLPKEGTKRIGLDVADEEGADTNAACKVHGVVVESIEEWNGIDTTKTARRAWRIAAEHDIDQLLYDSIGVGAGVRGEMKSLQGENPGVTLDILPVNVGESPSPGMFADRKKNKDMFANLKAQLWWEMRRRFEKTYQYVSEGVEHPVDEMISIPNDPKLIAELSQPLVEENQAGKLKIESKKDMKRRGIPSPNKADSVILAFANNAKRKARARIIDI